MPEEPSQLEAILARLTALEAENKTLKERVESQDALGPAPGLPGDAAGGVGYDKYARHVTVATNAAQEYSEWSGKPIINAEGLVRNSRSNPVEG